MTKKFTPGGRRLNWRPDVPDHRDRLYAAAPKRLPKKVDLREGMRPVKNQGSLGSCTGHAVGSYVDYLNPGEPNASRLFIYYNERLLEGTVKEDAGATIRSGIKAVAKFGSCKESLHPYKLDRFDNKPTKRAYANAQQNKIVSYERVKTLKDLKASLAEGFPVVFGMALYESFETQAVTSTGVVPMPGKNETFLGGHAVLAVGYDDKTKRVLVRNSWGKTWGDGGYFTMPYDYVANTDLCDDFWTIRK